MEKDLLIQNNNMASITKQIMQSSSQGRGVDSSMAWGGGVSGALFIDSDHLIELLYLLSLFW
jgi:hypothetical protein